MNIYDENFNDILDAAYFEDVFNNINIQEDEHHLLQLLNSEEEIWEGEDFIKQFGNYEDNEFEDEIEDVYKEYKKEEIA